MIKDLLCIAGVSQVANIITSCLAIFGYLSFWKTFKKQKRIENWSENARDSLRILTETEEILTRFFYAINNHQFFEGKEPIELQLESLTSLNRLRNSLLLLRKDYNLVQNSEAFSVVAWIEKLERIIQHEYQKSPSQFVLLDILRELQLSSDERNSVDFKQLEDLRQLLLKIYEINK